MEEYRTFLEIVSELIDKGYALDFGLLENTFQDFQKPSTLNVATNDFLIDEVHRCVDDINEAEGATFVFAISSKRYHFKGIVVNALSSDETTVFLPSLNKAKHFFLGIINLIKHQNFKAKSITQKNFIK